MKRKTESSLRERARITEGMSGELVEDAMAGDLRKLTATLEMLDSRYDDIKSGRVKPIDGQEAFAKLRRKRKDRRSARQACR